MNSEEPKKEKRYVNLKGSAHGRASLTADVIIVENFEAISKMSNEELVPFLQSRRPELGPEQIVEVLLKCRSITQQKISAEAQERLADLQESLVTWTRRFTVAGWCLFGATLVLAAATVVLAVVTRYVH